MLHDPEAHPGTLPRRSDRRRARTRAALLEAGRALYALRGLEAVSVDEIVAAADVAKGSFYNHFRDKDGLAREIAGEVRRQAERLVEAANAGVDDPPVRIARALCVFIRFAIDHRDSAQILWRLNSGATMADAPVNRNLRAEVERGIAAGSFAPLDVASGVLLIMGVVVISMRHALEERAATPPAELARGMATGLLRALGTPARTAARVAAAAAGDVIGTRDGLPD
ncbi:MAG: helix-turn-helix transcriptional regulator [Gammaproteobacteria bacterium]|nr:helix-turn-helix transcriptional regulator [Gammaproteobacteria bacterium]